MRRLIPLLLSPALIAGCSGSGGSACDRYGSPGAGSAQRLADALEPGEVGCLRSGRYTGDPYVLHVITGGVTLRSAPGQRARLRGTVWVAADRVRLDRLSIEGTGRENVVKVYAADVAVTGSDITNRSRRGSCLLLGSAAEGPAVRPRIARNVLHDCGSRERGNKDHAIYASRVRDGEIAGNLIINPSAYAVQLYPDARRVAVTGNVVDATGSLRGGVVLGGDSRTASRDNLVERNVLHAARPSAVNTAWAGAAGTGNVVRANCVPGPLPRLAGIRSAGNVTIGDPFRDRRAGDYRLPALSACRVLVGATPAARRRATPRP